VCGSEMFGHGTTVQHHAYIHRPTHARVDDCFRLTSFSHLDACLSDF